MADEDIEEHVGVEEETEEVEEAEAEDEEDGERGEDKEHISKLNAEAKKHRLRAKELARQLVEAQEEIKQLKAGGDLRQENQELRRRMAFNDAAHDLGITDRDAVFTLIADDLRAVEVADDGDADADKLSVIMKSAVERYPWAVSVDADDGEKPRLPKSPALGGTGPGKKSDLDALKRRYPALMQRKS